MLQPGSVRPRCEQPTGVGVVHTTRATKNHDRGQAA
jgi:hypothetical protein